MESGDVGDMTITEQMEFQKNTKTKVDVILDTDAYNEIDDLFAIAYMILSQERMNIKGILAAPFYSPRSLGRIRQNHSPKEGMLQSHRQILELLQVMGREDLFSLVRKGSDHFMKDETLPVYSEAAQTLVEVANAHSAENPLYVIGIAAITDIASALLIEPTIKDKVVIVWLGGDAYKYGRFDDFNAIQDIAAARTVFESGAPIVQLPCKGVVSEFVASEKEIHQNLFGKNRLCNYLLEVTMDFMRKKEQTHSWVKVLWDVTAVAWLQTEKYMDARQELKPHLGYDRTYSTQNSNGFINYIYHIHCDELMDDLWRRLERAT